jgi:hypothetical protein
MINVVINLIDMLKLYIKYIKINLIINVIVNRKLRKKKY